MGRNQLNNKMQMFDVQPFLHGGRDWQPPVQINKTAMNIKCHEKKTEIKFNCTIRYNCTALRNWASIHCTWNKVPVQRSRLYNAAATELTGFLQIHFRKHKRKRWCHPHILSSKTVRTALMSQLRSSVITSCCVKWSWAVEPKWRTVMVHIWNWKTLERLGLQRWYCQARQSGQL